MLHAMAEFHFKTPMTEADARKVSIGDSVYLDGIVFGVRDGNLSIHHAIAGCKSASGSTSRSICRCFS